MEIESCLNHLKMDEPLKIDSDVSFTSEIQLDTPEEEMKERLNEIENDMQMLGFNAKNTKKFIKYVKQNKDFLELTHLMRVESKNRVGKRSVDLRNVLEDAGLPGVAEFEGMFFNGRKA